MSFDGRAGTSIHIEDKTPSVSTINTGYCNQIEEVGSFLHYLLG